MADKKADILWPGIPQHFTMSSGTSSGRKFIPVSGEAMKSQRYGRLTALANYSMRNKRLNQLEGPMLFFSAPSSYVKYGKYEAKLISSLLSQSIPAWLKKYNLPGKGIDNYNRFDARIGCMVREAYTNRQNIRGMVAFPPWLHLFLLEVAENYAIDFKDLFPNFSLLITSGMNYRPYAPLIREKMGSGFDHMETYPSSEGFLAFTDTLNEEGMSFMPANGIFFEFIKANDLHKNDPERICIEEVSVQEEYAVIITTNSGLWSFVLGDTIKFISTHPWKFNITGRIGSTLSLVSESVTLADTDNCISAVCRQLHLPLFEFMCSAHHSVNEQISRYEWIVECAQPFPNKKIFAQTLHREMQKLNVLYEKFSHTGIIQVPEVTFAEPGFFISHIQQSQNFHAQIKMPHICVDHAKFCSYKKTLSPHSLIKI